MSHVVLPPATPERSLPARIGPYRVARVLGEGGMGTVYLAEQDAPHRAVALKVIRSDLATPELLRRFDREAEVLGRLQHPAIAQIYQAGTADGPGGPAPYIAMEYVEGVPVTEHPLARAAVRDRLRLFIEICDAVHYAHQRGVIHRDLKPGNILVDAAGRPKVLDFGVARLASIDRRDTIATEFGQVLGSLPYMSPEQVAGDPLELDVRSDVYALGVVLYELLTGRLPLALHRRSLPDALRVILSEEPAPLGTAAPALRGDLETIGAKALAKEKERRYDSAQALAADVRRYLANEPIAARPPSAVYQLRKFARRNRALVAASVVAVAALVAGTVASSSQAVRASRAQRVAESERATAVAALAQAESQRRAADAARARADAAVARERLARLGADSQRTLAERQRERADSSAARARQEASRATDVQRFLRDVVTSTDPSMRLSLGVTTARDLLDSASARLRSPTWAKIDPVARGMLDMTIGRALHGRGALQAALMHEDSAAAYYVRSPGEYTQGMAGYAYREAGITASTVGDLDGALARFRRALAVAPRRLAEDREVRALSLVWIGRVLADDGRETEGDRLLLAGLDSIRAAYPGGDDTVNYAERMWLNHAAALHWDVPTESAYAALRERMARASGKNARLDVATTQSQAVARVLRGDGAGAESLAVQVMPVQRAAAGEHSASYLDALESLGRARLVQGRAADAERMLRTVLDEKVALYGAANVRVALARRSLAEALLAQGRPADAAPLVEAELRARADGTATGSTGPRAESLRLAGQLASARGDAAGAEARLREALAAWRTREFAGAELETLRALGTAVAAQGRAAEADSVLRDALRRAAAHVGPDHAEPAHLQLALARVRAAAGARGEALTLADSALDRLRRVQGPGGAAALAAGALRDSLTR